MRILLLSLILSINIGYINAQDYSVNKDIDSLRLDKVLKNALSTVNQNMSAEPFFKKYETIPDDSSYGVTVKIQSGNLFSKKQSHLLIHRECPWATYINLYLRTDKLIEVIYREQPGMTYIGDSIADVNGDGIKDFLVHWYPSSGCCRRDIYSVYLNQKDKGTFSKDYKFINPTFSPKEKIIRGVSYGHPGEVGLYKYKWNGLKIDTIEYIYPNVNKKGQFIKTNKNFFQHGEKEGILLNAVPKEYVNIKSFDWFIDF